MKVLLFIVLKIMEVVGAVATVCFIAYWTGVLNWVCGLPDWILYIAFVLSLLYLILTGFFKEWFSSNRKLVDKLIK